MTSRNIILDMGKPSEYGYQKSSSGRYHVQTVCNNRHRYELLLLLEHPLNEWLMCSLFEIHEFIKLTQK